MLNAPEQGRRRHVVAARVRLRRLGDAGRGHEGLRGGVRLHHPRGLRALARPRRSPRSTTPTSERKPGSIGTPIEGVEMKVVDDDGNDVAQGDVGEIVIRGHNVMKGYWEPRGRDRGGHARRLVPHRRHGHGRRGRLLLHRRPQEGHDHPRRLQRLPARDRGGALRAPGRLRGRGHRRARRLARRGGRARWSCSRTAPRRPRTTSAPTSRSASPPTSTRARSGSSTSSRRARRARSSSARSRRPTRLSRASRRRRGRAAGLDALVGGDPLVELRHRARARRPAGRARARRAACCRARAGRRGAAAGRARRSRRGSRSCRRRRRRSRSAAPRGARRALAAAGPTTIVDAVADARAPRGCARAISAYSLVDLEARQPAALGQPAGDADRPVAGERADLDRHLARPSTREERQQRALVGPRLHPGVAAARRSRGRRARAPRPGRRSAVRYVGQAGYPRCATSAHDRQPPSKPNSPLGRAPSAAPPPPPPLPPLLDAAAAGARGHRRSRAEAVAATVAPREPRRALEAELAARSGFSARLTLPARASPRRPSP